MNPLQTPEHLTALHALMVGYPQEKRFGEKWISDPEFRSAFLKDPIATIDSYGIDLDHEEIRAVHRGESSPILDSLHTIRAAKEQWTEHFYGTICQPTDDAWIAWRKRQISRQIFDLGPQHALSNIHSSLAIELNKGCSVGCWFCALSPDRTSTPLRYHEGGKQRFASLVRAMSSVLGPAVQSGFLYWATEPMDNPNYEEYCLLFHELTGVFPPTTTAIPHKHPDRIRRLLQLAREHNSWLTRFSVLSVSLMNKVHQMFTAEELSIAECLPLNREGSFAYGVAGRYRDYLKKHPEVLVQQQERLHNAPFYQDVKDHLDSDTHAHGSIACVTGFLVNLVDCSVSLIAPTHATDEFPLGYITFASGTFTESENIQSVINDVVTRGRINTPAGTMMCMLAPYISYETLEGDVVFTGRLGTRVRAADLGSSTNVSRLMQTLREGGRNHTEILSMFPDDQQWIEYALERLWTMGVLLEPVAC